MFHLALRGDEWATWRRVPGSFHFFSPFSYRNERFSCALKFHIDGDNGVDRPARRQIGRDDITVREFINPTALIMIGAIAPLLYWEIRM